MLEPIINGTSPIALGNVLNEVKALIPIVLPVIIGFIAFRKGLGFLKSALKGA